MVPGGPQGPVPADGPVPGAAFPHPALVLCLLVVVLVMAVVAPAGSRGDDGPGLPRGVIRAVFCRKRGKLRAGGAGTPGVPSPPPFTPPSAAGTAPSRGRARLAAACSRALLVWAGNRHPTRPRRPGQTHANPEGPARRPEPGPGSCLRRGKHRDGRRENERRSQGNGGELTLAKGIDFKPGHFLGQDGFWQVEEGRIVDWEIVVIVLQDPDGRSLDAAGARGHKKQVSIHRGHAHGWDRTGREHGGLAAGTRTAPPVPGRSVCTPGCKCTSTNTHARMQMHTWKHKNVCVCT